MEFIRIGKIVDTHGMSGDLKILPMTDNPEFFEVLTFLMLANEGTVVQSLDVTGIKPHKEYLICSSKQLNHIDDAESVKGLDIVVPENLLPEPASDEVYWRDIEGALVVDETGAQFGVLKDYIESGSSDVFQIESDNGERYLISNNPSHVLEINDSEKIVKINREGLVSDDI